VQAGFAGVSLRVAKSVYLQVNTMARDLDRAAPIVDYGGMEGDGRTDAPPTSEPERKHGPLFLGLFRGFPGLRRKRKPEDTHAFASGAAQFHPVVRSAVRKAMAEAEEQAKWEAGSPYGRRVWPLLLGPQRYRDPAIYAPPDEARPERGGTGPDAHQKLPLTEDPQYEETLAMLDELDGRMGWPGDPA
jgi:hypothetical protein